MHSTQHGLLYRMTSRVTRFAQRSRPTRMHVPHSDQELAQSFNWSIEAMPAHICVKPLAFNSTWSPLSNDISSKRICLILNHLHSSQIGSKVEPDRPTLPIRPRFRGSPCCRPRISLMSGVHRAAEHHSSVVHPAYANNVQTCFHLAVTAEILQLVAATASVELALVEHCRRSISHVLTDLMGHNH